MHANPRRIRPRVRAARRLFTCLALVLCTAGGTRQSLAQPAYTLLDLGGFGPAKSSFAYDINNLGQVVGETEMNPPKFPSHTRGFRSRPGQPLDPAIDDLGAPQDLVVFPRSINDKGQVAGTYGPPAGPFRAFRTGPDAPIHLPADDLGALGGADYAHAAAINDLGQVVGRSGDRAFRTAPDAPINPATDDLAPTTPGAATALNQTGQVVFVRGDRTYRTGPNQPLNLDTDDVGTLGGNYTHGYGINERGYVVGEAADGAGVARAFVAAPGQGIAALGTPSNSYAVDINEHNAIVGGMEVADGAGFVMHALLYQDGRLYDLNDLIEPNSGWTLTDARGINDLGQIVGWGLSPDQVIRGFVLTPVPEPSAVMLLAAGTLVLCPRNTREPLLAYRPRASGPSRC